MIGSVLQLETLLVKVMADASQFNREMDALTGRLNGVMGSANKMAVGLTAAFTGMFGVATKQFASFDNAMTRAMIRADLVGNSLSKAAISKEILDMSTRTVISQIELAEAFGTLAASGRGAATALKEVDNMQQFAVATGSRLQDTLNRLIGFQNAMGLASNDMTEDLANQTRMLNVLSKAQTMTRGSVEEMIKGFTAPSGIGTGAVSASIFKNMHMEFEDVIAGLLAMSQAGQRGTTAGTTFARTANFLRNELGKLGPELDRLNLHFYNAQGQIKPIPDLLDEITRQTAGMSDKQKDLFYSNIKANASMRGSVELLLPYADLMRQARSELGNIGDVMKMMADAQLGSFANQWRILVNTLRAVTIEIGSFLAPLLLRVNQYIRDGLAWWRSLDVSIKQTVIGVIAAGIAFSSLSTVLGILPRLFWLLLTPLTQFISLMKTAVLQVINLATWLIGLGAVGWSVIIVILGVVAVLIKTLSDLGVTWDNVGEKAKESLMVVLGFLYNIRENLVILWQWLKENWKEFGTDVVNAIGAILVNVLKHSWGIVKAIAGPLFNWLKDNWGNLWYDATRLMLVLLSQAFMAIVDLIMVVFGWLHGRVEQFWGGDWTAAASDAFEAVIGMFVQMLKSMGMAVMDWALDLIDFSNKKEEEQRRIQKQRIDERVKWVDQIDANRKEANSIIFYHDEFVRRQGDLAKQFKIVGLGVGGDKIQEEAKGLFEVAKKGIDIAKTSKEMVNNIKPAQLDDILDIVIREIVEKSGAKSEKVANAVKILAERELLRGIVKEEELRVKNLIKERNDVINAGPGGRGGKMIKADTPLGIGMQTPDLMDAIGEVLSRRLGLAKDAIGGIPFKTNGGGEMLNQITRNIAASVSSGPALLEGFKSVVKAWPAFNLTLPKDSPLQKLLDKIMPKEILPVGPASDILASPDYKKLGEFKAQPLNRFLLPGQQGFVGATYRAPVEVHAPGVEKEIRALKNEMNKPVTK